MAAALAALACNGGLQPTPVATSCPSGFVGICGTVKFRGAIPDSTAGVYIVAYTHFPQQLSELTSFTPIIPQPLPLPGDSTTFYAVPIPSGRYEWVLAAWRKQGTLQPDFSNADSLFREGFLQGGADTTVHGSGIVVVERHRNRLDQHHRRLQQHAPDLLLLPVIGLRRVTLVAGLVLALAPAAAAQQTAAVFGTVRDSVTGTAVEGAQIAAGAGRVALTDAAGRYTLLRLPPGKTVLSIRRLGYDSAVVTLTLAAGDSVRRDFVLVPLSLSLAPVIVTWRETVPGPIR